MGKCSSKSFKYQVDIRTCTTLKKYSHSPKKQELWHIYSLFLYLGLKLHRIKGPVCFILEKIHLFCLFWPVRFYVCNSLKRPVLHRIHLHLNIWLNCLFDFFKSSVLMFWEIAYILESQHIIYLTVQKYFKLLVLNCRHFRRQLPTEHF